MLNVDESKCDSSHPLSPPLWTRWSLQWHISSHFVKYVLDLSFTSTFCALTSTYKSLCLYFNYCLFRKEAEDTANQISNWWFTIGPRWGWAFGWATFPMQRFQCSNGLCGGSFDGVGILFIFQQAIELISISSWRFWKCSLSQGK